MNRRLYTLIIPATLFVLAAVLTSCNQGEGDKIDGDVVFIPNTAEGEPDMDALPVLTFKETTHDFGKVIRGEVVTYAFTFRNEGKTDLLIADISSTCGCTATEYPKVPVAPGEKSYVKVTFDSRGRKGFQNKSITVAANTQPSTTTLTIKAMVIIPELD